MKYLQVVLNVPLNQTFTYSFDETSSPLNELPKIGFRVEVRFGNRKMTGFITAISPSIPENCPVSLEKIRPIEKIVDKESLFTESNFEIAFWVSKYYLCSIGEAVFSMFPSKVRRETSVSGFSFENEISELKSVSLSEEQAIAVKTIVESTKLKKPTYHYLYGQTGSGKTEVFLQVAKSVIEQNKGVIYLVPEIGLTPQVEKAVRQRFSNTVAVIHSGLTPSQKLSEWKRILKKEARIVIGARSAIFAPVPDLGLIIIDEEHDSSYKSGDTPRYHARQVAMHRASKEKIPLLMGSATPSVEAWFSMKNGIFIRHTLTKRLAGGALPVIKTIDLSKTQNSGCISETLTNEIRTTLQNKKQTILFLNRRGFTHFFRCNSCGYEIKCKNCSVSMTYHKRENRLRCHYCSWSIQPPSSCPSCSSLDVGYSGFGTEYIESETAAKFPEAKTVRLDTDVLTKKGELEEKINSFRKGEYDILLGTQMVAKGLNFPNLQLVGVILADTGLHMPDFRAGERTFSLITQVAGRAGRYFPDGKVFVQTYNPLKEPIKFAINGEIEQFYEYELQQRKLLGFPPFSRLVRLVFRSANQIQAERFANQAAKIISTNKKIDFDILGPSECPILKISQNYRYQIILRGKNISSMQDSLRNLLYGYTKPQSVYIEYDIDPVSLL